MKEAELRPLGIEMNCLLDHFRPVAKISYRFKDGREQMDRIERLCLAVRTSTHRLLRLGACRCPDGEAGANEAFAVTQEFKQSCQSFVRGFGIYFWQPV
jgi:hypothetical protein